MTLSSENPYGERAVQIAKSKLGMTEQGGKNQGPIVEWSMHPWSKAQLGDWAKWCTAFVCTCLLEAGAPIRKVASTSCTSLWEHCDAKGWAWENDLQQTPLPGDIVFFADDTDIFHTALVEFFNEETNQIGTIEGNVGDAVERGGYELESGEVYGFARVVE